MSIVDITVPDNKKDEEYHRKALLKTMEGGITNNFHVYNVSVLENYNYFHGIPDSSEFEFLQKTEDGKSLPAIWIEFNGVKAKCLLLEGQLDAMGYDIRVKTINKDAKAERYEFRKRILARMSIQKDQKELAQISGVSFDALTNVPETMEQLNEYMDNSWKDNAAIVMEYILQYNYELYSWKYKRLDLFRSVVVVGRCFVMHEWNNGYPCPNVVKPGNAVWDTSSQDDFLSDMTFFGHFDYMPVMDVINDYKFSTDEIKMLQESKISKNGWRGLSFSGSAVYGPYSNVNGENRVMVFKGRWLDYKNKYLKKEVDELGNESYEEVGDDYDGDTSKFEKKRVLTVRKGSLIAGQFVRDWGELENMSRSVDNPSFCRLGVSAFIPYYTNGRITSIVDGIKGMQKFKNALLYRMQLEINTAGRKGIYFNASSLPKSYAGDFTKVFQYMKTHGVIFYEDDTEYADGKPPVSSWDNSIGSNIINLMNVATYLDAEMSRTAGISPEREGITTGPRQLAGVTDSNINHSNLVTRTLFSMFTKFEEDVWGYHASQIKIAWANKEKFAHIIGDVGIDFLKSDLDLSLFDHGIFIDVHPPILQDRQRLENLIEQIMANGNLELDERLELFDILVEKDTRGAFRKLKTFAKQRKQVKALMEQAANERQAEHEREGRMYDYNKQQEGTRLKGEVDMERDERKGERVTDMNKQRSNDQKVMQEKDHDFKLTDTLLKANEPK